MYYGIYLMRLLLTSILASQAHGIRHRFKVVSTVVGGTRAGRHEYPWQVLLFWGGRFQCGGTILNEWTVMTAAHCIIRDEFQRKRTYSIVAGERNRNKKTGREQTIRVKEIVRHADYGKESLVNDIALLHLLNPLVFKKNVQPVNLTDSDFKDRDMIRGDCYATGYGLVQNFPIQQMAKFLQELQVKVISNNKCNQRLEQYGEVVEDSMMCSYNEDIGVCQGDSGGPVGCVDAWGNYRQVGIVSWTPTSNCLLPPSVYTRVSSFLDWIEARMYYGPEL